MIGTFSGSGRVAMRRLLLVTMMFGATAAAHAADMPDYLRGSIPADPAPIRNWDGWYAGGHVDYSSANIDLSHAQSSLTSFILRNTVIQAPVDQLTLFQPQHAQSTGFGAFVGRNFQWDEIVAGVEANYTYINGLSTSAQNQMGRRLDNPGGQTLPSGHTDRYDVTLTGATALQVKDVVTFRGRVGWATGDFLPYMFGGVAVGRMATSRSVSVTSNEFDVFDGVSPLGTPIHTETLLSSLDLSYGQSRSNNYVLGYTGGLGTEMMLFDNVFARVEWEYVKFVSVMDMTVSMNSVHAGLGYKF
jgi:outer membrane immunogenic protein